MTRKFKKPNNEELLKQTINMEEALPSNHLARFVVDVIAQLDLDPIYAQYAPTGGEPIAPEILLGLLFYGYANGVFSSRKIEKATYESIPFHYIASGMHPDHDTIANFRKTFLAEIQELFVQILLLAQVTEVLKLGNISLDGSKVHADATKRIHILPLTVRGPRCISSHKVGARYIMPLTNLQSQPTRVICHPMIKQDDPLFLSIPVVYYPLCLTPGVSPFKIPASRIRYHSKLIIKRGNHHEHPPTP